MIILGLANDRGSSYLGKLCRIARVQVIFYYLFVQSRSLFVCRPQGQRNIFEPRALTYFAEASSLLHNFMAKIKEQIVSGVFCWSSFYYWCENILCFGVWQRRRNPGDVTRNKYAEIWYRKSAGFRILLVSEFYFFYKFHMLQVIFVWLWNPKTSP